jgi:hypothetical protein
MKKTAIALLTFLLGLSAMAQDAPKNNFKLYGFIRNYFAFDSRESVSGTADLFYYLPKDVNMNEAGTEDLNATASFRFLALTSRLGMDVSGYHINNVHFGAKVEGDFYSGLSNSSNANAGVYFSGNTKVSGTATARLRQAYATVTWKDLPMGEDQKASVSLKMGQAWHPMAADMPHAFGLEAGAPFGPFSRTPQVTMDASLGKNWILSASAIWQMQYQSNGPIGSSALYIKYSKTPEVYLGVSYKNEGFLARVGVDVLSITPRMFSSKVIPAPTEKDPDATKVVSDKRVNERKTSVLGYAYLQYAYKNFSVKAKTTYGESGEHMNIMSGYAKVGENEDGSWNYASLRSSSSWLSLSYGKKWQGVLYLGYMKNLGLAEEAAAPIAKADVYFCSNGFSNMNQMYRINPQVLYNIGKMNIGLEYQWTAVQYGKYSGGKLNNRGLATEDLHWVGNNRINMMVKFNF